MEMLAAVKNPDLVRGFQVLVAFDPKRYPVKSPSNAMALGPMVPES